MVSLLDKFTNGKEVVIEAAISLNFLLVKLGQAVLKLDVPGI